jgi:hypothetical protein
VERPLSPRKAESALAEALEPMLLSLGLQRVVGVSSPAWGRPSSEPGVTLYLTVQADSKARDSYSGGGIRFEFQKSTFRRPDHGLNGRALFFQLLDPAEREQLLQQQNAVIRSLRVPPREHVEQLPAFLHDQYRSYFEPQADFDPIRCWLRFRSFQDVGAWGRVISPMLRGLLDRAEARLDMGTLHLGQGPLFDRSDDE